MADDRERVLRSLAGDRAAFGELVEAYQGSVFGLALSKLGSFAEAEDAAQDAFVAAYLGLAGLRAPDQFARWLNGIVANVCRMQCRRRAREVILPPEAMELRAGRSQEPAQDEEYEAKMRGANVLTALGRLSPKYREAIVLYYLEGMSAPRISRFLDASEAAIQQRLFRARAQLREEMLNMVGDVLTDARPDDLPEKVLQEIATEAHRAHDDHLHAESVEHYDRALGMLQGLPESDTVLRWRADMLRGRANAAYFLHSGADKEEYVRDLEASLAIERRLGRIPECAELLTDLAVEREPEAPEDARTALEEARELYGSIGEAERQAWCELWLAMLETRWFRCDEPMLTSEEVLNSVAPFQRALEAFEAAGDRKGTSLAMAALAFLRDLAKAPDAGRMSVCGWHSMEIAQTKEAMVFVSEPGFGRSQGKLPRSMSSYISHPDQFLRLPVTHGTSWSRPSFAYGQERMVATLTVESIDASVVVPAGTFSECVCVRTEFRREREDPSESYRRLNLRNSGTRYQWYAPSVGLAKVVFEHGDGTVSMVELTHCERGESSSDLWPLLPGYGWDFRSTDSRADAAVRDTLWVATRDGTTAHLAGHSMTETARSAE